MGKGGCHRCRHAGKPKDTEDSSSDKKSDDDLHEDVPAKDNEPWSDVPTRSGYYVRVPSCLIAEVGASAIGLRKAEENYYMLLDQGDEPEFDLEELIYVGAALWRWFSKYPRASC
jgi:hypothetical protein